MRLGKWGFRVKCENVKSIFQRERKTLLSDDKHFPWLLKNDINVAEGG